MFISSLTLAQAGNPHPGDPWLTWAIVLGLAVILGILLTRRKPDTVPVPTPEPQKPAAPAVPNAVESGLSPEVLAVIAASVAVVLGSRARIAAVVPAKAAPAPEHLQLWSVEGRRQIYSSHQIR